MAAGSLLTLLDDLAILFDDVAILTKVATKKTAGVLGDDLALNAEQVTGVHPERELAVVWAVAKGSARNKAILVPALLLMSVAAPWAVKPLLLLGGTYLCFEGVEKVLHQWLHSEEEKEEEQTHHQQALAALEHKEIDVVALEKEKIRNAIRTDFVLSAEIIVIALGSAAAAPLPQRAGMLLAVSAVMTVGVYGFVAGIVKLDDWGALLSRKTSSAQKALGAVLLAGAPRLLKFLSTFGTIAMFLVGGGIFTHSIPALERLQNSVVAALRPILPSEAIVSSLVDGVAGMCVGAVAVALFSVFKKLRTTKTSERANEPKPTSEATPAP